MLIELSDDLATGLSDEQIASIDLLLHSRRLGNHILVGSERVSNALLELDLSAGGRAMLRMVKHRQIQKSGLRSAVTIHVKVSCGNDSWIADTGNGAVINVGLGQFHSFGSMSPAVVLGENMRDARLGETMARYYARERGMAQVKLKGRCRGGGGDTTAETFRGFRDETRLCICIVDSDRKAPSDRLGSTARKVLREVDQNKPWACVLVTGCREAENQLSSRLIERGVDDDSGRLGMIPILEELDSRDVVAGLRDYCDLKKGTTLGWVLGLPAGRRQDFWLSHIDGIRTLPMVKAECVERKQCGSANDCKCWVTPNLGDGMLEQCLNAMEMMSTQKIAEAVCPRTRPHWEHVGSAVFSWTCGTERVVV